MKKFIGVLLLGVAFASPTILQVKNKNIIVNGQATTVITIEQPDGTWGYLGKSNESFDVIVQNKLNESTIIHWHGLGLPNNQDGTELTQVVIPESSEYSYKFQLHNTGTFWMHSHQGLQLAELASAPLIIESADDAKYQQVVVLFQDFSFESSTSILHNLKNMDMSDMDMSGHDMSGMDLNDVSYDAYLTNYHSPESPQITYTKPQAQVKLRFINASSSSGYWIDLGKLKGTAVAVDGHSIKPLSGSVFQLTEAQRMDILITIPQKGGTYPILGRVEGTNQQTGIILTTDTSLQHSIIKTSTAFDAKALSYAQELKLKAITPILPAKIDQVIKYTLSGSMSPYEWKINNQSWPNVTPAIIKLGSVVELDFINNSDMAHPMHLHGYFFQVVEIDGKKINGAVRDTILVLPHSTVKVVFNRVA